MNLITNEVMGTVRTIAVDEKESGWLRIVFVIDKDSSIILTHPGDDPTKLLVELQRSDSQD